MHCSTTRNESKKIRSLPPTPPSSFKTNMTNLFEGRKEIRNISKASKKITNIDAPGLPFSLVFRSEPGTEDSLLKIASSYQKASNRRISPPNFGPL